MIVKKIQESAYRAPVVITIRKTHAENEKMIVSLKCLDSARYLQMRLCPMMPMRKIRAAITPDVL